MIDLSSLIMYIEAGLFFLALYFLIEFVDASQAKKESKIEKLLKRLFGKKETKKKTKKKKKKNRR